MQEGRFCILLSVKSRPQDMGGILSRCAMGGTWIALGAKHWEVANRSQGYPSVSRGNLCRPLSLLVDRYIVCIDVHVESYNGSIVIKRLYVYTFSGYHY